MTPSTIHTDRLVLTPLAPEDAEEMITVLGDERMYGFSGGEPPTLEQLRRRYRRLAEGRSDDGAQLWLNWIARQHSDRAAVGALQATVSAGGARADVAWEIGVPWQGRGFGAEAAGAMVEWLIAEGVTDVRAFIHPDHHASARVAARAAFMRTDEVVDGEIVWRRTVAAKI